MPRSEKSEDAGNAAVTTATTPFPKVAKPALRALAGAGYDHLEQLANVPEDSLLLARHWPRRHRQAANRPEGNRAFIRPARMTSSVPTNFADLWCDDRMRQGTTFQKVLEMTSQPVDWAYDVWDELLNQLTDKNNRNRSIAAQVLCNVKMLGSKAFAQSALGRGEAIGEVDMDRFNVHGGSIAVGHPAAATGARIVTTVLNELRRRGGGLGLATGCAAGGLGAAMVLEAAS